MIILLKYLFDNINIASRLAKDWLLQKQGE